MAAAWAPLKPYAGRLARDSMYLVGPVLVLLFGSAVARWFGMDPGDYRDAAVPLALGLIAGVPVAVWLTRLGDRAAEGRERAEARARRRLVLAVIRAELVGDLAELQGARAERPREQIAPYLKAEAWRALSASGELRWIDAPDLLARIARAYHRIDTTTELERVWLDATADPAWLMSTHPPLPDFLGAMRQNVADQDQHTIASIRHAIAGIDAAEPDLPELETN